MIEFLIWLIVMLIVGGLLYWLVMQLPLPEPFKTAIQVCIVLIFILLLLGALFGHVPLPHFAR